MWCRDWWWSVRGAVGALAGRLRVGRSALWLLMAGLAGLAAVAVTLSAMASPPPPGVVLVARGDLPPGTLLDGGRIGGLVALAEVPSGVTLPGVLTAPDEALDRRLVVPVQHGEPITEATLGGPPGRRPRPLLVGERAVAAPLSAATGAAAALVPGALVDVVASTGEGVAGRTRVVVEGAEVLALVESPSDVGGESTGEALLRVDEADALRVTSALNFAREVRLLVRPPGEMVGAP